MIIRVLMAATVAGLSTFTGCEEDDGGLFSDKATLYFHNQLTQYAGGSVDDVTVDLFVDDLNTPRINDQEYTTSGTVSSETVDLDDDSQSIAFDVTGPAGSTLINGPVNYRLTKGDGYTLVMMGDTSLDNRQLKLFRQVPMDTGNQARIRFINTLSQISDDELSVSSGGSELVNQLEYGDASSYVSLNNTGTLTFTITDQTQALDLDDVNCNISSGRSYDAIIAYRRFDSEDDNLELYCQPVAN
ncbi:hypothetical protein A11A3_11543 [Alcanivorax hongdengensis A-11-3]|uniref:DUF4397 domain-containing protein n=1 Tax=Alcanivorax hongdengensis A-11-3 TaxID=1177179 RepID=L0WDI4_9GAMM|nr:DUF4397 domain-containing protein [Alcanivorax hongdengensis]EKF73840.1 hypothetical protein A11A3_11543 [Alcanivorax hongdengensis A-11-3]